MRKLRFFQLILAAGASLCIAAILLYFSRGVDPQDCFLASYSYQGPTQAVPGNPQLVRVEVIVRDSPAAAGVQIKSVDFNGQGVPLQTRDIYGNRGTGSFQLPPGKYKLRWTVQRDKMTWPRVVHHEEEVNIDPRDLWIQIEIVGNEASIR